MISDKQRHYALTNFHMVGTVTAKLLAPSINNVRRLTSEYLKTFVVKPYVIRAATLMPTTTVDGISLCLPVISTGSDFFFSCYDLNYHKKSNLIIQTIGKTQFIDQDTLINACPESEQLLANLKTLSAAIKYTYDRDEDLIPALARLTELMVSPAASASPSKKGYVFVREFPDLVDFFFNNFVYNHTTYTKIRDYVHEGDIYEILELIHHVKNVRQQIHEKISLVKILGILHYE